jgi:hypothetical protein
LGSVVPEEEVVAGSALPKADCAAAKKANAESRASERNIMARVTRRMRMKYCQRSKPAERAMNDGVKHSERSRGVLAHLHSRFSHDS